MHGSAPSAHLEPRDWKTGAACASEAVRCVNVTGNVNVTVGYASNAVLHITYLGRYYIQIGTCLYGVPLLLTATRC